MMASNISNGRDDELDILNGISTDNVTNVELKENSDIINDSNKTSPRKLLVKSHSEHLDLINKNVSTVNGASPQTPDPGTPKKKLSYDFNFLMSLRNTQLSMTKPDNIPKLDLVAVDANLRAKSQVSSRSDRGDNGNIPSLMGNNQLLPNFARSSPRGGTPNSRRSQHGKQGNKETSRSGGGSGSSGGGGGRQNSNAGSKSNIIQINLSRDVKLNESDNAWKPKLFKKGDKTTVDSEIAALDELCKKFRSILNKLSPQNFQKLIAQVPPLKIDTSEKLFSVIGLVFEKAIDEPGFSKTYALMCKELEQIKVKQSQGDGNGEQIVSFRKLILKRCQDEFEKASVAERLSSSKQKEIDECTDLDKKKELLLSLEEEERKLRVRSVGNVRFIGELFKQKYINSNIMIVCIGSLIKKLEEETMECLCKLLTTIGKDLETHYKIDLQTYIDRMKAIAEDKENKLNSRIRFMIKDVIDLRLNGWVPRQKMAPKKHDESSDSDLDRMNKNPYSRNPLSMSQRDDRMYSGRNQGSRSVTEDGWSIATPSKGNRGTRQPFTVDASKLKKMSTSDSITAISLQPSTNNNMWGRGSNTKKDVPIASPKPSTPASTTRKNSTKTSNAFNVLVDLEVKEDESKKPILTHENLGKSQFFLNFVQNDFLHCKGDPYTDLLEIIKQNFPEELVCSVARELIIFGLEFKKSGVLQVIGRAVGTLAYNKTISHEQLLDALQKSLNTFLKTSPPNEFWDFLPKLVWSLYKEYPISFWDLHKIASKAIAIERGFEFLMGIFMEKVEDSNEVHVVKKLWEDAGDMNLTDWMSEDNAIEFFKCMPLQFLEMKEKEPVKNVIETVSEVTVATILELMEKKIPSSQIELWIQKNVVDIEDVNFINMLTEAVYTNSLCSPQYPEPRFDKEKLKAYYPLLTVYVANKRPLELECLFAIQNLLNKLEHPQGIALQIYEHLWESGEAVSTPGFLDWEKDTTKMEGKGVMLMTLTSFYTNLKAIEDSSTDDSDDISITYDEE